MIFFDYLNMLDKNNLMNSIGNININIFVDLRLNNRIWQVLHIND